MRFLKININYTAMIEDFFQKYPDIFEKNYKEISSLYFNEFYWPSNSLEKQLKTLFNWECFSIILPIEDNPLYSIFYMKWCQYNNINSFLESKWDRLLFQIMYYDPDIIYIHEIWLIPKTILMQIKILKPSIKIFGWNCAPASLNNPEGQEYIDAIFTCSEEMKHNLISKNFLEVIKISHMFDQEILKSINKNEKKIYDVTFFGTLDSYWYQNRIDFFKYLIKHNIKVTIFGETDDKELSPYCKPARYGNDIYKIIKQSKIVLNIHVQGTNLAGNIRLFEVTGIGSMLLTDYKPNMDEIFKNDIEVVTFNTKEEALDKINYYLKYEKKREQIALKGQEKTISCYSYQILAKNIYNFSKEESSINDRYKMLLNINFNDNYKRNFRDYYKRNFRDCSNKLIYQTQEFAKKYNKIAIYGNGNVAKLIKEYLPNLVATFDKNILQNDEKNKIYIPEEIINFQFDVILITAWGYEENIAKELLLKYKIAKNKILTYNLYKDIN